MISYYESIGMTIIQRKFGPTILFLVDVIYSHTTLTSHIVALSL